MPSPNLSSPSADSLLLYTSPTVSVHPRYTADPPRGRSRERPIHLVRQALGIPHFGIAPGAVAPLKAKTIRREKVLERTEETSLSPLSVPLPLPILSRLPVSLEEGAPVYTADTSTDESLHGPRLLLSPNNGSPISGTTDPKPKVFYTQARLPHLAEEDLHIWEALHHFAPVRGDYGRLFRRVAAHATVPDDHPHLNTSQVQPDSCPGFTDGGGYIPLIRQAFNWSRLPPLPLHIAGEYYGVLFRSTRRPGTSTMSLHAADRRAHEEAVASGGLLMYWYGEPDAAGDNVATCLWTGREDARRASGLGLHRVAAGLAREVYETYELVRYRVRKVRGETGVRVEAWE